MNGSGSISSRLKTPGFFQVPVTTSSSADHGGHAGGVADGLAAHFLVAFLMVADVVDIDGLFLAVLYAGEDAADVGLALGAGAEGSGIRQQGLQELDGHDLAGPRTSIGAGGQHAHVLQTLHVGQVALAEGHEEADALDARECSWPGTRSPRDGAGTCPCRPPGGSRRSRLISMGLVSTQWPSSQ